MTAVAEGRGRFNVRVEIEGFELEFVTHRAMEQTLIDGRRRVARLSREGLDFEIEADISAGRVRAQAGMMRLVDDHIGTLLAAFTTLPETTTYLTSTVSTTDTLLPVLSSAGFDVGSVLHIGTEAMEVTGTTATSISVTRGVWGTIAQRHYTTTGAVIRRAAVTQRPVTVEGRRVRAYYYDDDDTLLGDGNLFWRGVVAYAPERAEDGATWRIGLDPITTLLQQEIGADLGAPCSVRGIYYPSPYPLLLTFQEGADDLGVAADVRETLTFAGFWETNIEFASALNVELRVAWTSWGFTTPAPRVVALSEDDWCIEVRKATGRSLKVYAVGLRSGGDSRNDGLIDEVGSPGGWDPWEEVLNESGALVQLREVTAGSLYRIGSQRFMYGTGPLVGSVPRGYFGVTPTAAPAVALGREAHRLYLDTAVSTTMTAISVQWPGADGDATYGITAVDEAEGWVEVYEEDAAEAGRLVGASATIRRDRLPAIKLARQLHGGSGSDLAFVLRFITQNAANECNAGSLPLVTSDDMDTALGGTIDVADDLASRHSWLRRRRYIYSKPMRMDEFLAPELLLRQLMYSILPDGRISFRAVRVAVDTEKTVRTLDRSSIVVEDSSGRAGFPVFEFNAYGMLNTATFHTGYDGIEDAWRGRVFSAVNLRSLAERKAPRKVEIKPKSVSRADDQDIEQVDVVDAFDGLLGFFGYTYAVAKLYIRLDIAFALRLGDVVRVEYDKLPSMAGGEGFSGVGQVMRLKYPLDGAVAECDVILHFLPIAGYAPSATVTGSDFVNSSTRIVFVSSTAPETGHELFPAGTVLSDHFRADDRVVVESFDGGATSITGIITNVDDDASSVTLSLEASWPTFPAGAATMRHADASSGTSPNQERYAYVGTTGGVVEFTVDEPARRWAP